MEEGPLRNKFELKYAAVAPDVIKALEALKRTGWVRRGVRNPESVQEHTISLRSLVISEIDSLDFSPAEKEEVLDMLEIHDWPESDPEVGDLVVLKNDLDRETLKKKKSELELEAMTRICAKLGDKGKRVLELWVKFETGQDPVCLFTRQVDKYQAIEKALEYQKNGETVSAQEFIDDAEEGITHPVLVKRLQRVKEELAKVGT